LASTYFFSDIISNFKDLDSFTYSTVPAHPRANSEVYTKRALNIHQNTQFTMSSTSPENLSKQSMFRDLLRADSLAPHYLLSSKSADHRTNFPFLMLPNDDKPQLSIKDDEFTVSTVAGPPFPFLKLPAEIRRVVYLFVLAGREITLTVPPPSSRTFFSPRSGRFLAKGLKTDSQPHITQFISPNVFRGPEILTIGLLSACSQIYLETREIPYTHNSFHIHTGILPLWLDRRMQFQVQALRKLSVTVHAYTWVEGWVFGDAMKEAKGLLEGLRSLEIEVVLNGTMAAKGGKHAKGWKVAWVEGVEVWIGGGLEGFKGEVKVITVSQKARVRWVRAGGKGVVRRLNKGLGGVKAPGRVVEVVGDE